MGIESDRHVRVLYTSHVARQDKILAHFLLFTRYLTEFSDFDRTPLYSMNSDIVTAEKQKNRSVQEETLAA